MYHEKKSNDKMRIGRHLFVWGLILALMASIAVGQVGPVETDAGELEGITAGEIVGDRIKFLGFPEGTQIKEALRFLSARYKKNIVPSPNITGVLSFTKLFDVTLEEAMHAILGDNFRYEQKGNIIKVFTKEEYKTIKEDTDRMVHKVFTLYYLTAAEAVKLVTPVLSSARKVEISSAAEGRISGGDAAGGAQLGGGGGDSLAVQDTIVIYDFPENIAKAEEVIEALDVRPKQVLVEATILSALLTEGMELGVDLNFMAGFSLDGTEATDDLVSGGTIDRGTSASSPIGDIDAAPGTPIETFGFAAAGGTGLRVGISCGDMRVFISALETVTDTTILANPKVLAVNKQEGTVLIGRNLGYRQTSSISSAGTEVEGEVLFLPTGTQLVFRPYIGNDGYIRMDIYPKDSTAELDADGVPQETTAELRTNVMVKDGETIVLGGLFRDVTVAGRQQVPLLGDIPIIGSVFRSTIDRTQREEVIILLTPHIIDAADQTEAAGREADISRKRYGARRTIQGISRARLAEDHYTNAVKLYTDGNSREALSELDNALDLRPTYLEALKLKERIIGEVTPDEVGQIERIMIGVIEREDTTLWHRR
ncbi:MAG: type II secretion system protein GspD [Planctomycetota bacterium]|jgi:type IV pilus assembly protein PilQ